MFSRRFTFPQSSRILRGVHSEPFSPNFAVVIYPRADCLIRNSHVPSYLCGGLFLYEMPFQGYLMYFLRVVLCHLCILSVFVYTNIILRRGSTAFRIMKCANLAPCCATVCHSGTFLVFERDDSWLFHIWHSLCYEIDKRKQ